MTEIIHGLTPDAARALTDEVKADAQALWAKLLDIYEGGAHTVLGYSSWADYCRDEFDMGRSRSYELLDSARVVETLQSGIPDSPIPSSAGVADELAPLAKKDPDQARAVWSAATDEHGPAPTAKQVAETRDRITTPTEEDEEPEVVDAEPVEVERESSRDRRTQAVIRAAQTLHVPTLTHPEGLAYALPRMSARDRESLAESVNFVLARSRAASKIVKQFEENHA